MKLLANENFPITSLKFLRDNGYDIIAVGSDFMGFTDREVIDLANDEDRTILTFDADYGELIFKHGFKPKKGVIFLRLYEFTPVEPGMIIHQLLKSNDLEIDNTITVIEADGIRQRKY